MDNACWCGSLMLLSVWYILAASIESTTAIPLAAALGGPEKGTFPEQTESRREHFFKLTEIELSDRAKKLLGGNNDLDDHSVHLPFWFDFDQYTALFGKNYTRSREAHKHRVAYLNECLRTLRNRVLFRTLSRESDAVIDEFADWVRKRAHFDLIKNNNEMR